MSPRSKAPRSPEEALSRALSKTLRHAAASQGILQDSHGWCRVNDLLSHAPYSNMKTTEEDIYNAVANNNKKRYELSEDKTLIRAVQGHSVEVDVGLTPLTVADLPQIVVHGTYFTAWEQIKTKGLHKMSRTHIHMASGLPDDAEVVSGMRKNSEVLIYIDGPKAVDDGIPIYRATNGAIVSPGLNGIIAPEYFAKVTDRKGNSLL